MNALVIRGREPILVDTGATVHSDAYIEAAFSLVDPADVRWIFLSHEDRDHAGSLMRVLDMCPNARLVTNAVAHGKLSEEWVIPPQRVYYANSGETFDAGDRKLTWRSARRCSTRRPRAGCGTRRRRCSTARIAFGTVVHRGVRAGQRGARQPDFDWGFDWFNRVNHVWHELADPAKVAALAKQVRDLRSEDSHQRARAGRLGPGRLSCAIMHRTGSRPCRRSHCRRSWTWRRCSPASRNPPSADPRTRPDRAPAAHGGRDGHPGGPRGRIDRLPIAAGRRAHRSRTSTRPSSTASTRCSPRAATSSCICPTCGATRSSRSPATTSGRG